MSFYILAMYYFFKKFIEKRNHEPNKNYKEKK